MQQTFSLEPRRSLHAIESLPIFSWKNVVKACGTITVYFLPTVFSQ